MTEPDIPDDTEPETSAIVEAADNPPVVGFVRVHHSDTDATIDVPEAALSVYEQRGWQRTTPNEKD
jgi:hypothetical protein